MGHLCTDLHIFGIYRLFSILGSFYIFEASRGSGEGGSVDLGGGAHFYCMHGWVGWVWDGYASPQGHENRANKVAARLVLAQNVFAHQHLCDRLNVPVAVLVRIPDLRPSSRPFNVSTASRLSSQNITYKSLRSEIQPSLTYKILTTVLKFCNSSPAEPRLSCLFSPSPTLHLHSCTSIMGAAASTAVKVELAKPADASDLKSEADARAEVRSLDAATVHDVIELHVRLTPTL